MPASTKRSSSKSVLGFDNSKELNSKKLDVENDLDDSLTDSEDEEEDDEGDLITPTIDQGINEVLSALKSDSSKLKDTSHQFFPEIGAEGTKEAEPATKKEKPVYLKDYQREQILQQDGANKIQSANPTYEQEQETLKNDFIKGFHSDDDGDDDGDLLVKRAGPERKLPEIGLPDPEKDSDGFLSAFINQKGWLPKAKEQDVPTYDQLVVDRDEDSDEFDDLTEKFESAYNFRYEDPEAAEIVSYARDQSTLRREKLSSRQKKREKAKAAKAKEMEGQKLEMAKLKKTKVDEVANKFAQLQEALGQGDEEVAQLLSKEDLDGDWDNDEWDRRMQKLFDDEYYGKDAGHSKEHGIPVGDVVAAEDVPTGEEASTELNIREGPRLSKKQLKRKAETFVEQNQDLLDDAMIPEAEIKFRYRQVDAESFGLTARDILLASDKELNQFAGIKKLASYRDKSIMEHDRKRYSKSKRLREWRKETFGSELPPDEKDWEKAKEEARKEAGVTEQPAKKRKKHSKKSKK